MMHILRMQTRTLDETATAVDLAQTPADIVFLSFSDSDLGALAAAWGTGPEIYPSLRMANLAQLKHPYSVDLYVAAMAPRVRLVLVRLLGGLDYWRYGVDEFAAAARRQGFDLAIVPGDMRHDERLDAASTLPEDDLRRLWAWFHEGGEDNLVQCLAFVATRLGCPLKWREPQRLAAFGVSQAHCRSLAEESPRALIVFYRSVLLSADTAPVNALADALVARGMAVTAVYVSSLKDPAAAAGLVRLITRERPDVVLNTTAFSGRGDSGACALDEADAPVLQVILSAARIEAWRGSDRGLSPADLAMNVVLPEIDGRIITRAISFKAEAHRLDSLEFTRVCHVPEILRVAAVVDLAAAWVKLRRTPVTERRIAMVLSDYPQKGGRAAYAVGLDAPASVAAIARGLRSAGYAVGVLPEGTALMRALTEGPFTERLPLHAYRRLFAGLPEAFRDDVARRWGDPAQDPGVDNGAFRFRIIHADHLCVALQPDRGRRATHRADYHDANLPPRHAYVAFYLWLRHVADVHAMIHCGTHGTLEWLPGKAVALDSSCAPEVLLGPTPTIYPFIVNNPGEAAQAKRRIAAVTIGHMTPPLVDAGTYGTTAEIESLLEEYAQAQALDSRRAKWLADAILEQAKATGLSAEAGMTGMEDKQDALGRLDAWLCDLKDMRIGDGLHVFGVPSPRADAAHDMEEACAKGEMQGLLCALDGRFVEPGPAGAPSRGRHDVLPTGRNLFTTDPRAVPTRTAWEIGKRAAQEVVTRYAQDHGEWPARIVIDLWGSATIRTGGDDLAQAMALLGVRPLWDHASTRVTGFEIESCAVLGRPRVDVTLRISGLFRDVFSDQIALFDEAVRSVATLDEDAEENPLAATRRIEGRDPVRVFGTAPGAYGVGLGSVLAASAWQDRAELGDAYVEASAYSYARDCEGVKDAEGFRRRVATADAFVHVQDMAEQDVLDSDAFAEHEGGFSAAAAGLGASPALYHVDATRPEAMRVRTLAEEVARVLRARACNPRWIEGQMRHGYRGAAEIAETLDNLFAYSALAQVVESRQFDMLFDATLGDDRVRAFLCEHNNAALHAMASRFAEARARGFWSPRRNSTAAVLGELREACA